MPITLSVPVLAMTITSNVLLVLPLKLRSFTYSKVNVRLTWSKRMATDASD